MVRLYQSLCGPWEREETYNRAEEETRNSLWWLSYREKARCLPFFPCGEHSVNDCGNWNYNVNQHNYHSAFSELKAYHEKKHKKYLLEGSQGSYRLVFDLRWCARLWCGNTPWLEILQRGSRLFLSHWEQRQETSLGFSDWLQYSYWAEWTTWDWQLFQISK